MSSKDFGAIENDYAFFMAHTTEAEHDAAQYASELKGFVQQRAAIRLLDFGCGDGTFAQRLLTRLSWPADLLRLALVEPVAHQGPQAAQRLARFSKQQVVSAQRMATELGGPFDVIISNHALYYVEDLKLTLQQLWGALAPEGKLLLAIAGFDNMLCGLWQTGFALLGQPVPYFTAEDVESQLQHLEIAFRKRAVTYVLRFVDSTEHRLKILRFLFGDHLAAIMPERLLGEFDRHVRNGHVEVQTHSYHFAIDGGPARGA